jgi:hypothetical protein
LLKVITYGLHEIYIGTQTVEEAIEGEWLELEKTGITTSFWCIDINPAIELFWSIWQVIEGEVIKESE